MMLQEMSSLICWIHNVTNFLFQKVCNTSLKKKSALCFRAVDLKVGFPDVLGVVVVRSLHSLLCAGQDFWELQSKNIWGTKFGNH